jgi:hypothetical protein
MEDDVVMAEASILRHCVETLRNEVVRHQAWSRLFEHQGESPEPALIERRWELPQREEVDPVLGALGSITEIRDQPPFHASQSLDGS